MKLGAAGPSPASAPVTASVPRMFPVNWVIVQGHTLIAGPVHHRNSSQLQYDGGTDSALWQSMVKGGVDVYLCGEVHDQTVSVRDGIVQIAHGSLFY